MFLQPSKIAIKTAASRNPDLVNNPAKMFGSQCIVGSIEVKRVGNQKGEAKLIMVVKRFDWKL